MQICSNCKIEKSIKDNFYKGKKQCKDCYRLLHNATDEKRAKAKLRYKDPEFQKKNHEYYKLYYNDERKVQEKANYQANRDEIIKRVSDYTKSEEGKKKLSERIKNRRKTDEAFRIKCWMRTTIYRCLNGKLKLNKTIKLIGYSPNEFLERFKSQIDYYKDKGIKFHIDHLIPLSWFIPGTPLDIINSLDNLAIVEATHNLSKNANYAGQVTDEYKSIALLWVKSELLAIFN